MARKSERSISSVKDENCSAKRKQVSNINNKSPIQHNSFQIYTGKIFHTFAYISRSNGETAHPGIFPNVICIILRIGLLSPFHLVHFSDGSGDTNKINGQPGHAQ